MLYILFIVFVQIYAALCVRDRAIIACFFLHVDILKACVTCRLHFNGHRVLVVGYKLCMRVYVPASSEYSCCIYYWYYDTVDPLTFMNKNSTQKLPLEMDKIFGDKENEPKWLSKTVKTIDSARWDMRKSNTNGDPGEWYNHVKKKVMDKEKTNEFDWSTLPVSYLRYNFVLVQNVKLERKWRMKNKINLK